MKMRIENVDLEFIAFDSRDVIMTSGGGGGREPIPTVIPMIWLSAVSVDNYNAYKTDDIDLSTGGDFEGFPYLAFSGALTRTNKYACSQGQDEKPADEYLFNVGKNDKTGYDAVFNWLTGKSTSGQ